MGLNNQKLKSKKFWSEGYKFVSDIKKKYKSKKK
jgi:hypothetical protein